MRLRKFNKEDARQHFRGIPAISIAHYGWFKLNAKAVYEIGLKLGDKINLHQDQDRVTDWYLEKTDDPMGLTLHNGKNCLMVGCQKIVRRMMESTINDGSTSASFRIVTQPDENGLYAIITSKKTR